MATLENAGQAGRAAAIPLRKRASALKALLAGLSLAASCIVTGPQGAIAQEPGKMPAFRLADAASLYLRQHADNTVAWWPWSDLALDRANDLDRLIFVSVGFSSCHWCHVLEAESFQDEKIGGLINDHYVAIKVDRETRPDLDDIFAEAMRAREGLVGHPINVILSPEGKPVAAFGYLPPDAFFRRMAEYAARWQDDPGSVRETAAAFEAELQHRLAQKPGTDRFTLPQAEQALVDLLDSHDEFHGGFTERVAKFPRGPVLSTLLDAYARAPSGRLEEVLRTTLDAITTSTLHDPLSGGFHRYTEDPDWLVPHFEKLLVTQAVLAPELIKAGALLEAPAYTHAGERALDFVLQEMRRPDGLFASALDAQSLDPTSGAPREGAFYLWTEKQIRQVFSDPVQAAQAIEAFRVTGPGPFSGAHALSTPRALLSDGGKPNTLLLALQAQLLAARDKRPPPRLDLKALTGWNGLMIRALAEAAKWTGKDHYRLAAEEAAKTILAQARAEGGRLPRFVAYEGRKPPSNAKATLADYTHFGLGLTALYRMTGDPLWLANATALADWPLAQFSDPAGGLAFASAEPSGVAGLRARPIKDEPAPSGNAALALLAAELHHLTGHFYHREVAEQQLTRLAPFALQNPVHHATALEALFVLERGAIGPVLVGGGGKLRATAVAQRDDPSTLTVTLDLAEGWHVNSQAPLQPYLVPTAIKSATGEPLQVTYPAPKVLALSFSDDPLAVFEGAVDITIAAPAPLKRLTLEYQVCSDALCLPPERGLLLTTGGGR